VKRSTRGAVIGALLATVTVTGCSSRQIDADSSGSVPVPGTSWQVFCDGHVGFIWIDTNGGADELEAVIYDHHLCVDDGDARTDPGLATVPAEPLGPDDPTRGDPDGIIEEED
jgi:hypothetical protein